jgi:glutamate-1-semialdehyde 2,1-aminomutase
MAAGLTQLRELERIDGWAHLEKTGAAFVAATRAPCANRPLTFQRIGSMFCLYFQEGPVRHLAEAMSSDRARFAKFFHGCLEDGVYFAPSQFEAGFLSTAHTAEDLEKVGDVVEKNLAAIF